MRARGGRGRGRGRARVRRAPFRNPVAAVVLPGQRPMSRRLIVVTNDGLCWRWVDASERWEELGPPIPGTREDVNPEPPE